MAIHTLHDRPRRSPRPSRALLALLALLVGGCSSILDFDKFRLDAASDAGPDIGDATIDGDGLAPDTLAPDIWPDLPPREASTPDVGADLPPPDQDGPLLDAPPAEDGGKDASPPDFDISVPEAGFDISPDMPPPAGTFVPITTGSVTFTMGSPTTNSGAPTTELCRPSDQTEAQHDVTLTRPFEMMNAEVTRGAFKAAMGYDDSHASCATDDCPANFVTWDEAAAYCNTLSQAQGLASCYSCSGTKSGTTCTVVPAYEREKIYVCPGFRLPTEAEWEYAARGGTTTAFYNGPVTSAAACSGTDANADAIAWYLSNSGTKSHPVALKTPNSYGLYDMLGNVAEWTHDIFDPALGTSPVINPWGALTGAERGVRGGDFQSTPQFIRVAARVGFQPTSRTLDKGFRCARSK